MVQVMYHAEWAHGMGWKGELRPYEPLRLLPSAQCLNYGQAVFEGLKAQRTAKGRIALFRPDQNAARMAAGAALPLTLTLTLTCTLTLTLTFTRTLTLTLRVHLLRASVHHCHLLQDISE